MNSLDRTSASFSLIGFQFRFQGPHFSQIVAPTHTVWFVLLEFVKLGFLELDVFSSHCFSLSDGEATHSRERYTLGAAFLQRATFLNGYCADVALGLSRILISCDTAGIDNSHQ